MKLLGLEGKGLLISVGITIIMCGAVTYYCHMRVKNVEVALMKQNQVLSSFITNVQGEIRKGGLSDNKQVDVSSPEARNAVKNIENSKIEVSDDDESDSETDDDDDDDSETDSDSEDDESESGDNKNKIKVLNSTIKDIKIVDILTGPLNDFTSNNKIIELTDLEEITDFANLHDETDDDSDDDSMSETESISDAERVSAINTKQELKKINLSEFIVEHKQEPVVNVEEIFVEKIAVEKIPVEVSLDAHVDVDLDVDAESNDFIKKIVKTEDKEKTSNINKMKIDDLREKVILSGLGTVESVKKLKKSDLITLLTEHK
jgi:hypothetical protein